MKVLSVSKDLAQLVGNERSLARPWWTLKGVSCWALKAHFLPNSMALTSARSREPSTLIFSGFIAKVIAT